jgi:hypothetical protein
MGNLKFMEDYLNENYEFKYNEVLDKTYFRKKSENSQEFMQIDNYSFQSIYRELLNKGISTNHNQLNGLLKSDFVKRFNPIQDYFNSLTPWDNKIDFIEDFCKQVKTTEDKYFKCGA